MLDISPSEQVVYRQYTIHIPIPIVIPCGDDVLTSHTCEGGCDIHTDNTHGSVMCLMACGKMVSVSWEHRYLASHYDVSA